MAPPQNKLNILTTDGAEYIKKLDFNAGRLDRQTVHALTGFSPALAKQVTHDAHLGSEADYIAAFEKMKEQIVMKQYKPTIYRNDKEDFHIIDLAYLQGETETFSSINMMLDAFYANKSDRDRIKQLAS